MSSALDKAYAAALRAASKSTKSRAKRTSGKWYVTGRDTFLSGWGEAKGGKSYMTVVTDSLDQAEIVAENMENRSDMRNVKLEKKPPRIRKSDHHSTKTIEDASRMFELSGYKGGGFPVDHDRRKYFEFSRQDGYDQNFKRGYDAGLAGRSRRFVIPSYMRKYDYPSSSVAGAKEKWLRGYDVGKALYKVRKKGH